MEALFGMMPSWMQLALSAGALLFILHAGFKEESYVGRITEDE